MNNECRETQAEPVVEKKRRNFCEYFYFSREAYSVGGGTGKVSEARAKLEALFGRSGASPPVDPRKKLESMFGGDAKSPEQRAAEAKEKLKDLFKKDSD